MFATNKRKFEDATLINKGVPLSDLPYPPDPEAPSLKPTRNYHLMSKANKIKPRPISFHWVYYWK
jgi:hypothetical protein